VFSCSVQVFLRMCEQGVAVDGVTCCSLINAMDKASQWQMAELLFRCMCISTPSLLCLQPDHRIDVAGMTPENINLLDHLSSYLMPRWHHWPNDMRRDSGVRRYEEHLQSQQSQQKETQEQEKDLAARMSHVQLSPTLVRT
jgi:hypothetical protein